MLQSACVLVVNPLQFLVQSPKNCSQAHIALLPARTGVHTEQHMHPLPTWAVPVAVPGVGHAAVCSWQVISGWRQIFLA